MMIIIIVINNALLWLCMQPKNERISAAAQCNLLSFFTHF